MNAQPVIPRNAKAGDFVVARPLATDAVGHSLRGVFGGAISLPDDMKLALARIDRARN